MGSLKLTDVKSVGLQALDFVAEEQRQSTKVKARLVC